LFRKLEEFEIGYAPVPIIAAVATDLAAMADRGAIHIGLASRRYWHVVAVLTIVTRQEGFRSTLPVRVTRSAPVFRLEVFCALLQALRCLAGEIPSAGVR
jgi:hypothetical protein